MPDVTQAPFLLDLLFVLARARMREQPLLHARDDDDRKLQSLRRMHRHQPDAARSGLPDSSSASDSRDSRSTKPPSEASASRVSYSRAADTSSIRFSIRSFGFLGVLVAQILQVAGPIEHLADRDRHRVPAAPRAPAPTIRSLNDPQGRDRAGRQLALVDGIDQPRPERSRRDDLLQARGEQRRRIRDDRIGIDRLKRIHHALADASRRHVDHPPEAHVVVRIDDQLHVRERVLDFLALVEANAADDLVGNRLAHQRVFDRPRLRVGAVQDRDRRLDILGARLLHRPRDEVRLLELVAAAELTICEPPLRSVHRRLSLRLRFCWMTAVAASRMTCVDR